MIGLFAAAAIAAGSPSLLGIELGKPLKLPGCPGGPALFFSEMCITRMGDSYLLTLPHGPDYPGYICREGSGLSVRDDVVVAIRLCTKGIDAQDEAEQGLKAKFGKPTSVGRAVMQNGFGARYVSIHAKWRRQGYIVLFQGMSETTERGSIWLMTNEEFQRENPDTPQPTL